MKTKFRLLLYLFICIAAALIFSSCGATVDTVMTVDGDFAGTRVMTLTVEESDLSNITGGKEAMDKVISENIPSFLSGSTEMAENDLVMKFTLSYSDKEDYIDKVNTLLGYTADEETAPKEATVLFNGEDTPFKTGVSYSENFNSQELMQWLKTALIESEIVTYSDTGDWSESGSNTFIYDDEEFSAGSGNFAISETEENNLDDCAAEIKINTDNTISVGVSFNAGYGFDSDLFYEQNGETINDYMKNAAPEGVTFEENSGDEGYMNFVYRYTADSPKSALETLNKLLKTDDNVFTCNIEGEKDMPGYALITSETAIDSSYYCSFNSYVSITAYLFQTDSEENAERESVYCGETYKTEKSIRIPFKSALLDIESTSKDKYTVTFTFENNDAFAENIIEIAGEGLTKAIGDTFPLEETETGYTFSVTGTAEEISERFSENFTAASFVITSEKVALPEFYMKGTQYNISYLLDDILGTTPLTVSAETSETVEYSNGALTIIVKKLDIIKLAALAVLLILFIVFLVIGLTKIKDIKAMAAESKAARQAKKASAAAYVPPYGYGYAPPAGGAPYINGQPQAPAGGAPYAHGQSQPPAGGAPYAPGQPQAPAGGAPYAPGQPQAPYPPQQNGQTNNDDEEELV